MKPVRVHLYGEARTSALDLSVLYQYLTQILPVLDVSMEPGLTDRFLGRLQEDRLSSVAAEFARAKVRNPLKELEDFTPLPGEIEYERRRLTSPGKKVAGILYDAYRLMDILQEMVPEQERNLSRIHIVFTNQLFGTWDEDDRRYHARVSIYGFPSIISVTGIVEAPAKPREYYLLKQQYTALGMGDATAELAERFRSETIGYDDDRLTEVMKGYLMQAVAHHLWGDPFCAEKDCRLYNAHWQHEVIRAQLDGEYEFCPAHQRAFEEVKRGQSES